MYPLGLFYMRAYSFRTMRLALLIAALPTAASAQGRWDGVYVGGFIGYADGRAHSTAPYDDVSGYFYNVGGDPYAFKADGVTAGGLAGAGWQSGAAVFGIEGELGYMDLGGTKLDPNAVPNGWDDTFTSTRSDLYGAVTARLGIDAGPALIYVKGGAAFLAAKGGTVDDCVGPPAGCGTETLAMTGSKTLAGWVLGGGVQWALGDHWDLRAEYAYFDFGHMTAGGPSTDGRDYAQTIGLRAHTVKLGVGYRW